MMPRFCAQWMSFARFPVSLHQGWIQTATRRCYGQQPPESRSVSGSRWFNREDVCTPLLSYVVMASPALPFLCDMFLNTQNSSGLHLACEGIINHQTLDLSILFKNQIMKPNTSLSVNADHNLAWWGDSNPDRRTIFFEATVTVGIWGQESRIRDAGIGSVLGKVSCADKLLRDSWNRNGVSQSIRGVKPWGGAEVVLGGNFNCTLVSSSSA